jgi:hypothetical protein
MVKTGEISWKINKDTPIKKSPKSVLEPFLNFLNSKVPNKETLQYCKTFRSECIRLTEELAASKSVFRKIPLVAAFLDWVQEAHSHKSDEVEEAHLLLKNGFIGLKDSEGSTWTLYHAFWQNPNEVYNAIRCKREWSLSLRERMVRAYEQFILYLSGCTSGFIVHPETDSDKVIVMNRVVKLDEFIHFADHLKDKLQLIAKLLYFGGDRTLEDILQLAISNIHFEKLQIDFGSNVVSYPLHIFVDIKSVIGKRIKGKIFLGRQNALLNSTTVFRNFKEAGIKSGLGAHFSPALLTKDKS